MSHRHFRLSDLALTPGSIVLRRVPTPGEQATYRLNRDLLALGADLLASGAGKPDLYTVLKRCKAERAAFERAQEINAMTAESENIVTTATDSTAECPLDLDLVGLPQVKPLTIDQGGELAIEDQIGGMPAARAVALDEIEGTQEMTAADYLRKLLTAHMDAMPKEDWSSEAAARRYLVAYDQWLRIQLRLMKLLD